MNLKIDGNDLFAKIVWGLIVCILTFCAKKFNDMANDISNLNITMVEVVTGQKQDRKLLDDHELRIRILEKNYAPVQNLPPQNRSFKF